MTYTAGMKTSHQINPERAGFLAMLLILTLTGISTWTNWPQDPVIDDARVEFSTPYSVEQVQSEYTVALAGNDPLVPRPIDYSNEKAIKTTAQTTTTNRTTTRRTVPRVNTREASVMLQPKNTTKPVVTQAQPKNQAKQEKPFPVQLKGIAKFPDSGYKLVLVDADGEYSRLQEGDDWVKDGQRLQIRKIYPEKVVFLDNEGKVHTLEFTIMGSKFSSDSSDGQPTLANNPKGNGGQNQPPRNTANGGRQGGRNGGKNGGNNNTATGGKKVSPADTARRNQGNRGGQQPSDPGSKIQQAIKDLIG